MISSWTSSVGAGAVSLAKPLHLGPAENAVLDFVGNYSAHARLTGAAVLAKMRGRTPRVTHVLARIDDLTAHRRAWTGGWVPFARVYAQDDAMSFEHEGAAFVVENLLPEDFSRQLTRWREGRGIAFAHEAVSYHPATKRLHDPADAVGEPGLKLTHPGRNLGEAFDIVLRGMIEAEDGGLTGGEEFARLHTRVLSATAGKATSAQVARSLVQRTATLAEVLPAKKVAALLRSRLVDASLAETLGVSGETAARALEMKRGPCSNAAVLLATLLGPEIANGSAAGWLQSPDRFASLCSRAALAEARSL